jgi:hypothetical protein
MPYSNRDKVVASVIPHVKALQHLLLVHCCGPGDDMVCLFETIIIAFKVVNCIEKPYSCAKIRWEAFGERIYVLFSEGEKTPPRKRPFKKAWNEDRGCKSGDGGKGVNRIESAVPLSACISQSTELSCRTTSGKVVCTSHRKRDKMHKAMFAALHMRGQDGL